MGLYGENGKENGNYRKYRCYIQSLLILDRATVLAAVPDIKAVLPVRRILLADTMVVTALRPARCTMVQTTT